MIEGSRLLKVMMEDFRSPVEQARGSKMLNISEMALRTTLRVD